jgi:hypothetical protein
MKDFAIYKMLKNIWQYCDRIQSEKLAKNILSTNVSVSIWLKYIYIYIYTYSVVLGIELRASCM